MAQRRGGALKRSENMGEDWKERAARVAERLRQGVEAVRQSKGWAAWLDTAGRFRKYSPRNIILIQTQCPGASFVAGYRRWQELGYHVRKGEKALYIYGPERVVVAEVETEGGTAEERVVARYWPLLPVFDFSQVEAGPGAKPLTPTANIGSDEELYRWAVAQAQRLGYSIEEVAFTNPLQHGALVKAERRIKLAPQFASGDKARTVIHEIAHALVMDRRGDVSVHEHEAIAEATAYAVCKALGRDVSAYSFPYIASWQPDDEADFFAIANEVLANLREIIPACQNDETVL